MTRSLFAIITLSFSLLTSAYAEYKPSYTVVKDFTAHHVAKDGSSSRTMERQYRVDTAQGVKLLSERKFYYSETLERAEVLEAYTIQPDGTRITVVADAILTQDDTDNNESIYNDRKVKVIIYPKLEVGSQVYYRAKIVRHTPEFTGHFYWGNHFSPHFRYDDVVVEFSHDPGIQIAVDTLGMKGGKIEAAPSDASDLVRYRFTFSQDTAYPVEGDMVDLADFAPHFSASSFKTYADVGRAYQTGALPKTALTPPIEKLAKDLTAKAKTDKDKVRILYHWVSQNIRYLALHVGTGGHVPHEVQSIFNNRYGDCKDHVVILEAMLRAVGIESTPALLNASDTYFLPKLPTAGIFDHVITYIPSLDLYLDSTSRFAPVGALPTQDMDKPVLHTATGVVARTPVFDPAKDYTDTRVSMKLLADGSVEGKSLIKTHRIYEVESRSLHFSYLNKNQEGIVNKILSRFHEGGDGEIGKNKPTNFDLPWQVDAKFKLDPVVNVPGPSAMTIPIGLTSGKLKTLANYASLKNRRFPTSASCMPYRHIETTDLAIPTSMKILHIPSDMSFNKGDMHYRSTYRQVGNLIKVRRELSETRKETICSANYDTEFKALSTVLRRDFMQQVFFE